jgi:OOP family OmpA-OmpF porin
LTGLHIFVIFPKRNEREDSKETMKSHYRHDKCPHVGWGKVIVAGVFCGSLFLGVSVSQEWERAGKEYPDGHGGTVYFPAGDISFADEVISFEKGNPAAGEADSQPEEALGVPDYDRTTEDNYLSLGCGGVLTLKFTDNVLIDIEGPDLYVFEIGPAIEPTNLAISKEGKDWVEIGEISGGRADIDISPFVKPGDTFHFVRLTDLKTECGSAWPGADIDAVGAIGSAIRISLKSSVLFDFDKATLKPEAAEELHAVALKIKELSDVRIIIEGHTDNFGTDEYNRDLSMRRAAAVKEFFVAEEGMDETSIESTGFGESRPIATNDTDEGRAKNRRVEIIILPKGNL